MEKDESPEIESKTVSFPIYEDGRDAVCALFLRGLFSLWFKSLQKKKESCLHTESKPQKALMNNVLINRFHQVKHEKSFLNDKSSAVIINFQNPF